MSELLDATQSMRPRIAVKPPRPPQPLIDTSQSSPPVAAMADVINDAAAPFQAGPDPAKGTLGQIEHGIGMAMGVVGAPFELLDTGFALATAPLAALMPGLPAATLLAPHLGMPHGHTHPPSLVPPAPPVPLPSIGTVMCAGCVSVLIGGIPAARAGDVGLAVTCGSLAPAFEVYTGSSNTWIGGSRAARMGDITRHCNPASAIGKLGAVMGAVGVAAGAVGAGASATAGEALRASMQAAQAAADAVALAMSALLGKDPGLPPSIGALLLGNPTVLVGGFPLPDLLDVLGGALKGLKKLGDAVKKSPRIEKALARVGLCNDPGEPVSSSSGVVYNDFEDFRAPSGFRWERHYRSDWNDADGPLGYGFRHYYDRRLLLLRKRAVYEAHDGERVSIPRAEDGGFVRGAGFTLVERNGQRYTLLTDRDEELEFVARPSVPPSARLVRYVRHRRAAHLRHPIELRHDDQGRLRTLLEMSDGPRGATPYEATLHYDDAGRIREVRRGPRGEGATTISRYAYEDGCLVRWQDALGNTAHMRYDAARRMVRGTDRRGYSFHWHYDAQSGRCIRAHGDDGLWGIEARYEGSQSVFKEADGGEWTFKHFPDGVVSHILDPEGGVLEYVRDAEGKIVRQILPGGTAFTWFHDRDGKHYGRADQWGHQLLPEDVDRAPRDPLAHDGPLTHKAWLWGRPLERLSKPLVALPANIAAALEALGPATGTGRDPARAAKHDARGQIIEQPSSNGATRRFRRDAEGNVVAEQDGRGNWSQREITSWNLLGATQSPLGSVTRYAYTQRERWSSIVDPHGNRTDYVRDGRQRVRKLRRNGRPHRSYSYDAHDRVIEERDAEGLRLLAYTTGAHGLHTSCALASGEVYRYDHDSHGRPTRASSTAHEVELAHLRELRRLDRRDGKGVEHRYESWLAVLRTTYFGRFVVQYEYRGAPGVRIRTPDGGVHTLQRADDGLVVRQNANGTHEATVFDAEGRLCVRACWTRDDFRAPPFWTERYHYGADGELTTWVDSVAGPVGFEYDADRRLVAQSDARGRRAYAYDRAGNVTSTPSHRLIHYGDGNRVERADFDHFEHDESHRLCRASRVGAVDTAYVYDSKGQLLEARFSDRPEVWRAAYDGLGRRLWREYAGARTDFYWDGDRLAAERAPDGALRLYVYANEDALVPFMWLDYASEDADPASGTAHYLYAAPNGMPLRVEDARREVVWRAQAIDPYGCIQIAPGARVDLRLRFAGHFHDEHLDLFYNRFRDYDPKLGRYLQPDPIDHEGGINLYAYPANPWVDVDLRGLIHRKATSDTQEGQQQELKDLVAEEVRRQRDTLATNGERARATMVSGVRNTKTGHMTTSTNTEARAGRNDLHPIVERRVETQEKIIGTHQRLRRGDPPKTTAEINDMDADELRRELANDGIDPEVEGMDTAEQLRRTNDRAKFREDQLGRDMDDTDYDRMRDENGNHGEVKATSDQLEQIEKPPPDGQGRPATAADIEDLEVHNQRIPRKKEDPISDDAFSRCDHCRGITEGAKPTPELQAAEAETDQAIKERWP